MPNNDWGVVGGAKSYVRWLFSSVFNSRFSDVNRPLLIVTGSDSSHFFSQMQFLASAVRFEPEAIVVMWDLGLSSEQVTSLQKEFPEVQYRKFPYDQYPEYFDVTKLRGEYAWKPVAIELSAREFSLENAGQILLWCDAGNVIFKPLRWARRYVGKTKVFAPFSRGNILEWTHPATIEYFQLDSVEVLRSNCCSCFVGFDLGQKEAWDVITNWAELASKKEIFAPPGSSRGLGQETRHRQDQSVLTCLLVRKDLLTDGSFRTNWTEEYLTHQDIDKRQGVTISKPKSLFFRLFERVLRNKRYSA